MTVTVNEVRKRLFKFVDPIIRTPEFYEKYVLFSDFSLEDRFAICEKNVNLSTAYIQSIASHLDVEDFSTTATKAVPPEIILTTYAIYWTVTQTLVHMKQNRKITVPDSDAKFLIYMFSEFLEDFTDI